MPTPITGAQTLSAEALSKYLLKNNPNPRINCTPLELATLFIKEGLALNIRGDIAFCQSIHETGWFKYGGQVLPEQNNYAGIGATNNSPVGKGAWFDTPEIGVRAQIQHLFAYATKETIIVSRIVDPRFNLVTRGIAPNWEDLNGRWAVPGTTYGQTILKGFENAVAFADTLPKPVIVPETPPTPGSEITAPTTNDAPAGTGDKPSGWAKDATIWAKENSIFAGDGAGNYDWQGTLTREQAAQLLYNFAKKFKL